MAKQPEGGEPPRQFSDREKLENWLQGQKREVAVAIAARAALRVAPFAAWQVPQAGDRDGTRRFLNSTSAIFRATAVARVAGEYPTRANALRAASDASYAAATAINYGAGAGAATRAAAAAIATSYRANAAAAAADAVATADRAGAIWAEVSADARALAKGDSLATAPLWTLARPDWSREHWERLKAALPKDENWRVWIDWYEDRLKGRAYGEAKEFIFATVPEAEWQKGPAAANKWIADELAKLELRPRKKRGPTPQVPAPKPAAIEPVIRGGKIALSNKAPAADLEGRSLGAALEALKQQFQKFVGDIENETNIDKRILAHLRDLAERLPEKRPAQELLFGLGHELETLQGYDAQIAKEWPDAIVPRYRALTLAFDRTWRQFPKWREFKRNAERGTLEDAQIRETAEITTALVERLRLPALARYVDPALAAAFATLAAPLAVLAASIELPPELIHAGKEFLALDVLESIDNLLKLAASAIYSAPPEVQRALLQMDMRQAAETMAKAGTEEAKRIGEIFVGGLKAGADATVKAYGYAAGAGVVTGAALILAIVAEKATGVLVLSTLVKLLPEKFKWAEQFVQWLLG